MTADTPAAIARRLTPAQRRALLAGRATNISTEMVLHRLRLFEFRRAIGFFTPLGLAVRAEVEREGAGDQIDYCLRVMRDGMDEAYRGKMEEIEKLEGGVETGSEQP